MRIASFTLPDLCPPHEYFQAVKLTNSYPIVLSGYSWEVVIRHVTDLFNAVDFSSLITGSPEAANTLFDLSQSLEDLGMHHYSYTVATWAQVLRRNLYNSDKDMHRRDLASSFCLKAKVLAGLGRIGTALTAAQEAVHLCYEDQALQGVQLAKALYIQAPLLNAAGRKSEAKVVAKEMVSILGALGEDKPHLKHFLSFARALLSDILLDMNEYDEALAVAQDAIKSARALIGMVDSRPALSIALLVKARVLAARGDKASAYIAAVQAVRHLRDLTSERPAFTTFLAHALILSSRYLHTAGFYWEARKHAEEAVETHRTLHTSAPQAFAAHYAEAVGQLVRLRVAASGNGNGGGGGGGQPEEEEEAAEVFDMAQHAAGLFRETAIRDSEALADVLLVIASTLFDASRAQEAGPSAEEAVGILRPRWKRNAEEYAPRFVRALGLAAACRPSSEAGLDFAKEAVEAHRPRKDLDRATHERILTHLLMDVFSRLRELDREVEAIRWKTEAARLNKDVVESLDPPAASADYQKGLLGNATEHGPESESEDEVDDI
jgi:tetratricopeptide (TPR) repeat protein